MPVISSIWKRDLQVRVGAVSVDVAASLAPDVVTEVH